MATLEEKDSFKSLDSAFENHHCCQIAPGMSENCNNVESVESSDVGHKPNKFNSFLRRSHSERNQPKNHKQKHGKSRTFSSIFLKKRVEEKRTNLEGLSLESKSSQTSVNPTIMQMECSGMSEVDQLKKQNSNLVRTLDEKESQMVELDKEKERIFDRIRNLEMELEESRLANALARGTQREKEVLKKRLEALNDEKESQEFHMAFLEEEKMEAEQKVKELLDDLRKLKAKFEKCESDREIYKKKFLHTKSHARKVISDYIGDVNELIQENRFLIKKGLRGQPKELEKILRVTEEYLVLESEKNRFQEASEILSERLAIQEVKTEDLKRELVSAVILLEKAGVDWKPVYDEDIGKEKETSLATRDGDQDSEKFVSPREEKHSEGSKIRIPLSITDQRPVPQTASRITVL